jgi:hypothetical protein
VEYSIDNGITVEQYDELFSLQNEVCKICLQPEMGKRLAIDHNHTTGQVRGLLCQQCNCLIGFIENKNIDLKYLKEYLKDN